MLNGCSESRGGLLFPLRPHTSGLSPMLPQSNGQTVLLVDDSFIDLHLYSRPLREAGYRPITSLIGPEFGGIHVNEHPSLILLDYRLKSNVSALDLVKILRDLFPESLIVLLSVLPDLPAEMKGLVDGFLHKGDPARLAVEVQNLLDEGAEGAQVAKAAD